MRSGALYCPSLFVSIYASFAGTIPEILSKNLIVKRVFVPPAFIGTVISIYSPLFRELFIVYAGIALAARDPSKLIIQCFQDPSFINVLL